MKKKNETIKNIDLAQNRIILLRREQQKMARKI